MYMDFTVLLIFYERKFYSVMDEGGSCDTNNCYTTNELNTASITCVSFYRMPAMLFLLKNRRKM